MEKICSVLIKQVRKVRMFGCTGLDIVKVAQGHFSGLIQPSVRIWDFAAARIIIEESGGVFDASRISENRWEIIAGSPRLVYQLRRIAEQL